MEHEAVKDERGTLNGHGERGGDDAHESADAPAELAVGGRRGAAAVERDGEESPSEDPQGAGAEQRREQRGRYGHEQRRMHGGPPAQHARSLIDGVLYRALLRGEYGFAFGHTELRRAAVGTERFFAGEGLVAAVAGGAHALEAKLSPRQRQLQR
ncbi:hypothetical protein ACP_2009 [Acidobacterium capsulatum ATCC 51196]|uniref:Uncharacterized protein n=1 Tax=Acidobacterium capsulatum (strain ATCC 51196 / DSM 11244 / BCRC 80197 / JCM 7670 / NBRC 15755 / NCIMB 13165 / 161) TaxID=240015 RepID=C1F8V0_ACIC5|nr:hypothetical protein ACP_2009 [Acidobacterium capsulatum ATCC 51196]